MAGLQNRSGSFRLIFRYGGRQHSLTLGPVSQQEAEIKSAHVDYLLMRIKQGYLSIPTGMDIVDFVRRDGEALPAEAPRVQSVSLGALRDRYLETHSASLEPSTLACLRIHFRHLERVLGARTLIGDLTLADLQRYVDTRSRAKGVRKRKLSAATIRKEVVTLRTAYNWAKRMKFVTSPFPSDGLRYPKSRERPPFQTRAEIDRVIALGGLAEDEIGDLWDSLYLKVDEIAEFLAYLKDHGTQPFVYPMSAFAAHTGARRSEMIRMRIADVDLAGRVATIHEKKRVRGKSTTRRVPLSEFVSTVLQDWLNEHPGGPYLFCQTAIVNSSRKRSRTTGHLGEKRRPKSNAARRAGVVLRGQRSPEPLTPSEAHDHFQRSIAQSKWDVLRGWHTLRHSFVSACASRSVDQRLVEAWAGHMTTEMSRRYAHLWPSVQQEALARVFG